MRIRAVHTDGAVTELDNVEQLYFLEGDGNCELCTKACSPGVCVECKEETITEFADRCKECGSRYGKLLKLIPTMLTKADMMAMLTELQLEIEENVLADDPNTLLPFLQARETCVAIIQQKINALKAESEG